MTKSRNFATALHIITALVVNKGVRVKSTQLASSVGTNAALIRRILSKLAKAGLVDSKTGKAGGSKIARAAKDITLLEVYLAVEDGSILRVSDREQNKACEVSRGIGSVLCKVFSEVESAMNDKLAAIPLSRVVSGIRAGR